MKLGKLLMVIVFPPKTDTQISKKKLSASNHYLMCPIGKGAEQVSPWSFRNLRLLNTSLRTMSTEVWNNSTYPEGPPIHHPSFTDTHSNVSLRQTVMVPMLSLALSCYIESKGEYFNSAILITLFTLRRWSFLPYMQMANSVWKDHQCIYLYLYVYGMLGPNPLWSESLLGLPCWYCVGRFVCDTIC